MLPTALPDPFSPLSEEVSLRAVARSTLEPVKSSVVALETPDRSTSLLVAPFVALTVVLNDPLNFPEIKSSAALAVVVSVSIMPPLSMVEVVELSMI